eukprot:TRINITY_DN7254_c0_g1_i3.p1 TRINITY_DN7254_c0_g1~~TRINITY_DN7254_c0_g1_i3.p1  ORF type:complete len:343 (+),score=52.05 TRINITY_DN7254_c0_g1_i3:57-1085(+)
MILRFLFSLSFHLVLFSLVCSFFFFFLMIRRPPRSTLSSSSAASDVYKRQVQLTGPQYTSIMVASGSADLTIRLWDLDSFETVRVLKDRAPRGLSPCGEFGHQAALWQLGQLEDGRLASGGCDGKIMVWNLETAEPHGDLHVQFEGRCWTQLDNHRLFASSHAGTHVLWVWNLPELEQAAEQARVEAEKLRKKRPVMVDPSKKKSSGGGGVKKKKSDAMQPLAPKPEPIPPPQGRENGLRGSKGYIWSLLVLMDGRVASAGDDHMIRIWDLVEGEMDNTLIGHTAPVTSLCQLEHGRLGSASLDKTVRIWNIPPCQIRTSVPAVDIIPPDSAPPNNAASTRL